MNRHEIGNKYEELAAERLKILGYRIVEQNFRCREGEIDIVARDGAYLVFVEVRYRKNSAKGHPLETITPVKQRRICRASAVYAAKRRIPADMPVRYDVVGILDREIQIIQNAFEYIG